ncbi:general stress protein [bacterium K02(2017)]|nr:general stress protein [bacterium K02(2017)]
MVKVIAEFCQNHNGDYKILKEMIHQAAQNGATYAKIQTIYAEDIAYRERFELGQEKDGLVKSIKRPYQAEYDRLKKLELTFEQEALFINDCKEVGLIPMTTCFTRGSVNRLAEMDWKAIKIASYDCASLPLIKDISNKFEEMIISTGATYDQEIEAAANLLKETQTKFSFLHCVTIYPTPLNELHLNRMLFLKQFSNNIGLSSHPLNEQDGVKADLAAIYLGAEYIERHFTILKPTESRDGPVSINSSNLKEIIDFSKLSKQDQKSYLTQNVPEFEIMLGQEKRELSHQELLNRDYYRGRFATHVNDQVIYNWEDKPIN